MCHPCNNCNSYCIAGCNFWCILFDKASGSDGLSSKTSDCSHIRDGKGQIYTPAINYILMAITILFVVGFKTSDNIAAAYGVAVTTTMLLSTLLFYYLTTYIWKWNPFYTLFFTTIFLCLTFHSLQQTL